jgi:hypothetical protein
MGLADKLESSLRYASSDIDQSSVLVTRLVEENTKVSPSHQRTMGIDDRLNLRFKGCKSRLAGLKMFRTCCVLSSLRLL